MKTLIYTCDLCGADNLLKENIKCYSVKSIALAPSEQPSIANFVKSPTEFMAMRVPERETHLCEGCLGRIRTAIEECRAGVRPQCGNAMEQQP